MSDPVWSPLDEQVVTRLISEHSRNWAPEIRIQAEYLSSLWIGYDLWSSHFLGVDGQVFLIGEDLDHPDEVTVHCSRITVVGYLFWGSKRYPELKALLPDREPDAIDCPCWAHPRFAEGKVICDRCGGLGWLPATQD
jgi:hypothetical protein